MMVLWQQMLLSLNYFLKFFNKVSTKRKWVIKTFFYFKLLWLMHIIWNRPTLIKLSRKWKNINMNVSQRQYKKTSSCLSIWNENNVSCMKKSLSIIDMKIGELFHYMFIKQLTTISYFYLFFFSFFSTFFLNSFFSKSKTNEIAQYTKFFKKKD